MFYLPQFLPFMHLPSFVVISTEISKKHLSKNRLSHTISTSVKLQVISISYEVSFHIVYGKMNLVKLLKLSGIWRVLFTCILFIHMEKKNNKCNEKERKRVNDFREIEKERKITRITGAQTASPCQKRWTFPLLCPNASRNFRQVPQFSFL